MPDFGYDDVTFHDFTIYLEGSSIVARNNWTNTKSYFSNADISPVIENCISNIKPMGANNDTLYLGKIAIKKGRYVATSLCELIQTYTLNGGTTYHGVEIEGEGLGTTISVEPGSALDCLFLIGLDSCAIRKMRIILNSNVTQAIHVRGEHTANAGHGRRTDHCKFELLRIEGPNGGGGMYSNTAPVPNQRGIMFNGTDVAVFFPEVRSCEFFSLSYGVWCYAGNSTSAKIIHCTFMACETAINITDGSGQHQISNCWIQGDTAVGTTGINLDGSGKRTKINNITTELHKTATTCQAIKINSGVEYTYINQVSNVWDNGTTWLTVVDSSGNTTNQYSRVPMPYLNSYTYTIYQDGGAVKARNNKTGAVTSNANIDPLITTILASGDASFEVQSGTYNLHSSFAGWNVVNAITCFMQHDTVIKVPSGYTGDVWIFGSSDKYWSIIGGRYEEQSTVSSNWDVFRMAPASPNGVKFGIIRDVVVYQASAVFDFATATDSWVNSNVFDNILGDQCKKFAKFAHTSTFTDQTSGCNFNIFSNCVLQSHGSAPQVLAGFENVNGWFNVFQNCFVWDVGAGNASAVTLSFTANAKNNRVINGMIAHQLYSDLGTNNVVDDSFNGLLNPQINYNKAMSIVAGTTPGNMLTFNTNKTIDFNHRLIYNMFYDFGNVDTDNPAMFKVYDRSYGFLYKLGVNTLTADRKLKLPIMLADGEFLETGGKLRTGYLAVSTTPVTLDVSGPSMISVSASGGARTINLPAASGNAGQFYTIIKNDSSANTVTIDANSTETINGALTFVLTAQYQSVVLRCDGANWLTQPNSTERRGKHTASGNASTTLFNIAHGLGATPSNAMISVAKPDIGFTYTTDSTNIAITFISAPANASNNIEIHWSAVI